MNGCFLVGVEEVDGDRGVALFRALESDRELRSGDCEDEDGRCGD